MPTSNVVDKFSRSTAAFLIDATGGEITVTNPLPVTTSAANESLALDYSGNKLTTITKTVGGVSYVRTLSYTGDLLTGVSAWVAA